MSEPAEPRLRLRSDRVSARTFEDETLAIDFHNSVYLSLNRAATVLWNKLQQGTTRSGLISALLDEFDVSRDTAAGDVDAFLAEARARGLIVAEDERDPGRR